MSDNLTKTLSQILEEYFEQKLESGYQITDRNSALSLRKQSMTDLKLKKGNWTYTGKALEKVMEKRGIKVPDDMQAKSLEGIEINLIKSETPKPQVTLAQSPHSTLPRAEAQPTPSGQPAPSAQAAPLAQPATKIVTDDMAASWERGLNMGFGKLMALYAKIGAIEVAGAEPEKKKMTLADYQKETGELAHDWVTYCKENNVHLPKFFELFMLVLGSGVILGSPLFKLLIFGKKGKKTEEVKELGKDTEKEDSGNKF